MKRPLTLLTSLVAAPSALLAHPGHPGHDFEWNFIGGHYEVPLVLATLAVASAVTWWVRRRNRRA